MRITRKQHRRLIRESMAWSDASCENPPCEKDPFECLSLLKIDSDGSARRIASDLLVKLIRDSLAILRIEKGISYDEESDIRDTFYLGGNQIRVLLDPPLRGRGFSSVEFDINRYSVYGTSHYGKPVRYILDYRSALDMAPAIYDKDGVKVKSVKDLPLIRRKLTIGFVTSSGVGGIGGPELVDSGMGGKWRQLTQLGIVSIFYQSVPDSSRREMRATLRYRDDPVVKKSNIRIQINVDEFCKLISDDLRKLQTNIQ